MTFITLQEAESNLAELMEQAAHGEEIIITNPEGRGFKIVPLPLSAKVPKFGSAKGLIRMADDFDAPLPDFEEYGP